MNAVVTVNLGNNAYQLDESAAAKLRAYLASAERALEGNPDKNEIIADLESAIGEKCRAFLNSHKTVVVEGDIEEIITEMGPVAGEKNEEEKQSDPKTTNESKEESKAPKRFYRIREGSMVAGICTGLATYFDVDVTLVRIASVVLIFLTSGFWILFYIILAVITPVAETPRERAAASGVPPFTAQELINQAKSGYANFKNSKEWREWNRTFRENTRQWKRDMKNQYKMHHNRRWYNQPETPRHQPTWADQLVGNIIGLMWLAVISFGLWFGYHHSSLIHNGLDLLGTEIQQFFDWLAMKIN